MKIPEVNFNYRKTANREIEVIDLEELYEREHSDSPHPGVPHRIHFNNLIYIEEGEGTHLIDFVNYPYQSGAFIFVQKNQVHAFDFEHKPKGKLLIFTQAFIDQAFPDELDPLVQWLKQDPYHRTFAREEAFINLITFADPTRTRSQREAVRAWYDYVGAAGKTLEQVRHILQVIEH